MNANLSPEIRPRLIHPPAAGFTLFELLLTVALILVLTALYWHGQMGDPEKVKRTCADHLRKTHLALQIYAQDNGDRFPMIPDAKTSDEPLALLVPRYTIDTTLFVCPGSRDSVPPSAKSFAGRRISYAYYMGRRVSDANEVLMSDRQINTEAKQAGQQVFSSTGERPGNNHKNRGGNLLFGDGSVQSSSALAPISLVLTQGVVLLNPKP